MYVASCGCEQRGERKFLCSYHEGYEDATEKASVLVKAADAVVFVRRGEEDDRDLFYKNLAALRVALAAYTGTTVPMSQ